MTTAAVYEGGGRIVYVSMRTYPLTASGQVDLDAPASPYPLETQQLIDLAAATIWVQVQVE